MNAISYLESCNMWFAPLDEVIDALNNNESISGIEPDELKLMIKSKPKVEFYINNFDSHVIFNKED